MALHKAESETPGRRTRRQPRIGSLVKRAKPAPEKAGSDPKKLKMLMRAANRGTENEVESLLQSGEVHPDELGKWGDTALMIACAKGFSRTARVLLENGADPNARGRNLMTPLMVAVRWSMNPEIIDLLIENGARVRARNMLLGTALGEARWSAWLPDETMGKLEQRWTEEGPVYRIKEFFSGKFFGKKAEA